MGVEREPADDLGGVVRRAGAGEGDAGEVGVLGGLVGLVAGIRPGDDARSDGVDADVGGEVSSEGTDHLDEGGLGHGVRGEVFAWAAEDVHVGHGDDGTPAGEGRAGEEGRERGGEEERSGGVDGEVSEETIGRGLGEGCGGVGGGVVDEDVPARLGCGEAMGGGGERVEVFEVEDREVGMNAQDAEVLERALGFVAVVTGGEDDVAAGLGKCEGDGVADAARAAGDEGEGPRMGCGQGHGGW